MSNNGHSEQLEQIDLRLPRQPCVHNLTGHIYGITQNNVSVIDPHTQATTAFAWSCGGRICVNQKRAIPMKNVYCSGGTCCKANRKISKDWRNGGVKGRCWSQYCRAISADIAPAKGLPANVPSNHPSTPRSLEASAGVMHAVCKAISIRCRALSMLSGAPRILIVKLLNTSVKSVIWPKHFGWHVIACRLWWLISTPKRPKKRIYKSLGLAAAKSLVLLTGLNHQSNDPQPKAKFADKLQWGAAAPDWTGWQQRLDQMAYRTFGHTLPRTRMYEGDDVETLVFTSDMVLAVPLPKVFCAD